MGPTALRSKGVQQMTVCLEPGYVEETAVGRTVQPVRGCESLWMHRRQMTDSGQPGNRNMTSITFKFQDEIIELQNKMEKEIGKLGEK